MKKFTILIAALLVVAMGFAQFSRQERAAKPATRQMLTAVAGGNHAESINLKKSRSVTGTLQHCGEMGEISIGTNGAGTLAAAARFEASALSSYVGQYITKINVGIANADVITSARVAILTGTVDAPVVAIEEACTFQAGMNEVLLTVPYQIPASTAIMVAYEIVVTGGYPLGVDAGPVVEGANLVNMGGLTSAFEPLSDLASTLTYNFIISATVEDVISNVPILSVTPSQMIFEGFVGDATTASQQANVVALNLIGNINITTAAPFEVSTNNVTFGTSATLTSSGNFYVRYVPANAETFNVTVNVTIASTGAESKTIALSANTYDCTGSISELPFEEDFENGLGACWNAISNNTENQTTGQYPMGVYYQTETNMAWTFSSYTQASNGDYNQYLITPKLSLTQSAVFSFDYAAVSASYPETFKVMISTTNNAVESFADISELITASSTDFENYMVVVPNTTKYIAIHYIAATRNTLLFIDNIELSAVTSTPEIALTSVTPATGSTMNGAFNISGVVRNTSTIPITSYKVSYTIDGGNAVVDRVSGINLALGETHEFTHSASISGLTEGEHTIVVTVSEPNGVVDADASDNSMTITINTITCSPITTFPYVEDFENGVNGCWTFIDADGDGNNWMHSSARFDLTEWTAHSGTGAIVSESYRNSTVLYPDNWAITPALSLPANSTVELSFYAAAQDSSYSAEHYGVYVSTTTTDPSAFTLLWEETMNSSGGNHAKAQGTWRVKHTDLSSYAGQTIHIGFRHFNCSDQFLLLIDDITINVTTSNADIALTSVEPATNTTVLIGQSFNISGVVTNNETITLNSYKVSYSVDGGTAVVYNISGINVAVGGTHNFTHATPVVLSTEGTHTIVVTVSEPNGVEDANTSDNSKTITLNAVSCNPITTFPYTEDFENGLSPCWTIIDADGDGNVWANTTIMGEGYGHNASVNAIMSESYMGSALTPDNWAITPAIVLPEGRAAGVSFWAAVQDASYSAEHYGIYVSTTTTDPSAFTLVWEETMDANGGNHSKAQGTWREKHATLSNYVGQTIYIGFRHFNCTDQFKLLIDDVNISLLAQYTITALSANENMGTVTGGGTYNVGSSVELSATANEGYRFVRWTDGNTSNPRTITVTGDATYIATFEEIPTYTITVESSNSSMGTATGSGTYLEGSEITIQAFANEGYVFTSWNDSNTENPRTITVTGNATYIANFSDISSVTTYTINVLSSNNEMGEATGSGIYAEGNIITIEAIPYEGYMFASWNDNNTDNPRQITVTGDATYIASFEALPAQYTITVLSASNDQGSVAGGGTFYEGTEIQISATANEGFRFASWNDGNTDNPRTITVTGDATYIAMFEELPAQYIITVLSANSDQGSVAGGGTFYAGTEIQISAIASEGFRFAAWNDGNHDNPRTITVTGDATYIATFEVLPQQYTITVISENDIQGTVAGGGTFDEGAEIQITATPNFGYRFVSWNDGNTENPRAIIVTADATYIATFEALQMYTIEAYSDDDSNGTVTGGGTYPEGYSVTLIATPENGYVFTSWNDGNRENPRTITVTENATFIAYFADASSVQTYTITVRSMNDNFGTTTGSGVYAEGTIVTITAIPASGYRFVWWNDRNQDNPRQITVTGNATYTAVFALENGVEETSVSEISIFPNPTSDILNITSSETILEIEIVNVMGQIVNRMEVNSDNVVCDVEGLKAGMYFVRIFGSENNNMSIKKFVKE